MRSYEARRKPGQQTSKRVWRQSVLTMLIVTAVAARGERRMTVEQLRQFLAAEQAAHKSDAGTARRLNGIELTERLTRITLTQMDANVKPGEKTARALDLLADTSSFWSLPPPSCCKTIRRTPRRGNRW
jgi:hypothetical protein